MRMFNKLMSKLMLDCKQATYLVSINNFKKMSFSKKIQLKMHLWACSYCRNFKIHSHQIDISLHNQLFNPSILAEENLSEAKKTEIETTVNQELVK